MSIGYLRGITDIMPYTFTDGVIQVVLYGTADYLSTDTLRQIEYGGMSGESCDSTPEKKCGLRWCQISAVESREEIGYETMRALVVRPGRR